MTRLSILALIIVAATATSGCRKEEQNRPTSFTPGVYKGETTPTLTKQQISDLAKRGQLLK